MGVKPGYKQTEVGVIPEDWDVCPVRQKGVVVTGKALAVNAPGPQRPYLRTRNVFDGRIDIDDVLTMPMTDEQFAQFRIRNGDVLLNEGQSIELVGRCAIYQDEYPEPCAIQNALLRFRALPGVSNKFASYLFRHCQHTGVFARIALQTTSVAHLGGSRFEKLHLAWPTEPEQRAIAEALSDVDGLLGGLDRLIAKKRDLKQAAMQQLLTGQTRLPGFHGEWEVKAIHELSQVGRGRVISHTEISKSSSPTYPVFSSQTSNSGIMGYLDTYQFDGDYVTWTTDGANAGTVFARSGRFNCTDVCGTIKLHDSDHRFIAAALGRVSQSHVSRHLGNPKLMNDVMKKIEVTIPKTRAEQTAIAEVLTEMDGELAGLEQRREKTRALKQAMMQELLTGRTRLV